LLIGLGVRIHHRLDGRAELLSDEPRDWLSHAAEHRDGNHANAQFSAGRDLRRGRDLPECHGRRAREQCHREKKPFHVPLS